MADTTLEKVSLQNQAIEDYPHPADRPLIGQPHPNRPLHPRLYACECAATLILMVLGISTNVALGSSLSPLGRVLLQYPHLLTALQGFCFGASSTIAALSPFGRVSGGHLSPSISVAFTLGKRLAVPDLIGYILAQLVGALGGTALVAYSGHLWPAWGAWCQNTHFAATIPPVHLPASWSIAGECVATAILVTLVLYTGAKSQLRRFTPFLSGPLFFLMNPFEAWVSGDSTNMARSLGPAVFAGSLQHFWIYIVGPMLGVGLVLACIRFDVFGHLRIYEARIAHFGHGGRAPALVRPPTTVPLEVKP